MTETGGPICALTFDFDAMSAWVERARGRDLSLLSRGEFAVVGLERCLEVLEARGVRATFCVPGHTASTYPSLVRRIHAAGHELAHHGWLHEDLMTLDASGLRTMLERGMEALGAAAGIRPRGFRSPAWTFPIEMVDLLLEYEFAYDSSCMGHDLSAYYLRRGDRCAEGVYEFGELCPLVELPVYWGLDDAPAFEFAPGAGQGLLAPASVEATWRAEFDFLRAHVPDGLFQLTVHPEVIGRGQRTLVLSGLLDHMLAAGARFTTMGDYAEGWRAANPMQRWARENPLRAGDEGGQVAHGEPAVAREQDDRPRL
jgi:peptidoglycan/xylan/chitin deacetylase (PgdA/CDA1 family)